MDVAAIYLLTALGVLTVMALICGLRDRDIDVFLLLLIGLAWPITVPAAGGFAIGMALRALFLRAKGPSQ